MPTQKAVELAESAAVKSPNDGDILSYLALRYAKLGLRDKAASLIERVLALAPDDRSVLYRTALVYELRGDRTAPLKWLKAALANGYPAEHVQHDPDLKNLRADPAFRALLQ